MPIPRNQKRNVETFLRQCVVDKAKFVRAWAYNGFYELAGQYPEYQEEAQHLLALARKTEAASVKARVRGLMKKGFS